MRLRSLLLVALLAPPGRAQSGATVSGVVRDSISAMPLAGAVVQLVSIDILARAARATATDAVGRFALVGIPDGRYLLGFFHPLLDSLGLEPTVREVNVDRQQSVVADLGTPSPARLGAVLCGRSYTSDSGAVVIGSVRQMKNGEGVASATVIAEWRDPPADRNGSARRAPHIETTAAENGWFAICNVPRPGPIAIIAVRDADSTDRVEVEIPAHGLLRRELYMAVTSAAMIDTVRVTAARIREAGLAGFAERRRTGLGRFITPEDVARRAPLETSDLFRQLSGIRMDALGLRMRGVAESECAPGVFIDGRFMQRLGANDIDDWVRPDEIAGIEIYSAGRVPPQFLEASGGCGSIAIWTRPRAGTADGASWKSRVVHVLGVTAVGAAIGLIVAH